MAITYFQKYPKAGEDQSGAKSMRADHPDFGDVLRSVYAKGVITDFDKIQDDPIQVKSRVKVQIEGMEESDFIPIFFHPKAQYWDDPGDPPSPHSATDFNEEDKYHEKSWMSFRGGDEVAVLLQASADGDELKPVAVVAFADGVPRIGENVIRIDTEHDGTEYYEMQDSSNISEYGDGETGPDGVLLKLEHECEPIKVATCIRDDSYYYLTGLIQDSLIITGVDTPLVWGTLWKIVKKNTFDIYLIVIPVGAILYAFYYALNTYEESTDGIIVTMWGVLSDFDAWQLSEHNPTPPSYEALVVSGGTFWGSPPWPPDWSDIPTWIETEWVQTHYNAGTDEAYDNNLFGGVYTSKLKDALENSAYDTETMFENLYNLGARPFVSPIIEGIYYQDIITPWWPDLDTVIRIRPHTKEELIALEMWPKEE
jgi:hypothetical protein